MVYLSFLSLLVIEKVLLLWSVLIMLVVALSTLAWAFFLLLRGIENKAATFCRCATVIYISFTIGYDTLVGLNSGILASNALALPNAQQAIVQGAMQQLFMSAPIILTYYILLGSGIASICSAALALAQAGVPRLPIFVLLGTILSAYSHATPFGPLGSACFFLAALWIELVWRKVPQSQSGNEVIAETLVAQS